MVFQIIRRFFYFLFLFLFNNFGLFSYSELMIVFSSDVSIFHVFAYISLMYYINTMLIGFLFLLNTFNELRFYIVGNHLLFSGWNNEEKVSRRQPAKDQNSKLLGGRRISQFYLIEAASLSASQALGPFRSQIRSVGCLDGDFPRWLWIPSP